MRILSTLPFQWLNHKKALIGQRLSLLRHAPGRRVGRQGKPRGSVSVLALLAAVERIPEQFSLTQSSATVTITSPADRTM